MGYVLQTIFLCCISVSSAICTQGTFQEIDSFGWRGLTNQSTEIATLWPHIQDHGGLISTKNGPACAALRQLHPNSQDLKRDIHEMNEMLIRKFCQFVFNRATATLPHHNTIVYFTMLKKMLTQHAQPVSGCVYQDTPSILINVPILWKIFGTESALLDHIKYINDSGCSLSKTVLGYSQAITQLSQLNTINPWADVLASVNLFVFNLASKIESFATPRHRIRVQCFALNNRKVTFYTLHKIIGCTAVELQTTLDDFLDAVQPHLKGTYCMKIQLFLQEKKVVHPPNQPTYLQSAQLMYDAVYRQLCGPLDTDWADVPNQQWDQTIQPYRNIASEWLAFIAQLPANLQALLRGRTSFPRAFQKVTFDALNLSQVYFRVT